MATAPPRACPCGGLIREGKCSKCGPKKRAEVKKKTAERGFNNQWTESSKEQRQAEPLCRECEWKGYIVPSECIDHKLPHHGDQALIWDNDNRWPLCWKCHSRKSQREKRSMPKYVITGPPGAGKSTWVKAHARPGDLVFDADYLLATMFNVPLHTSIDYAASLVERMRAMVVEWVLMYPDRKAFIIQTNKERAARTAYLLGAELIEIEARHDAALPV